MSKCKTCAGRGRYQIRETYSDGDTMLVWYECNDCGGTGRDPNSSDEGDFDVHGEDDDD